MLKERQHIPLGIALTLCLLSVSCSQSDQAADENVMAQMRGQKGGAEDHPGKILYQQNCAACHNHPVSRAPHISFLQMLPGDSILNSMNTGVMRQMSQNLSAEQRRQVAEYLVGEFRDEPAYPVKYCQPEEKGFDYNKPPFASGWGIDRENTRFIPAAVAKLPVTAIPELKLQWVFAYPGATRARSQPSLVGGTVVVGSQDGTVYSLNADTGCVRWSYRASAEVRTGITTSTWQQGQKPARAPVGYFADLLARVYAVNLETGEELWSVKVDEHPNATVTAQPVLYKDKVYVTISSLEVVPAANPDYECCTFRGAVVSLDANTGKQLWKTHTIKEEPKKVGVTSMGTAIIAPSGAPSWNSPTIDEKRQHLYIGTGENYSSPAQGSSDSIIALDINTGQIIWIRQTTEGDAWNVACMPFIPNKANCPVENGPDVDFGAPPILVQDGTRSILAAGQKSGDVYGIAPEDGTVLWQQKVGRGGNQGGVHFGMAVVGNRVFVPVADFDDDMMPETEARPGLFALDVFSGRQLWYARPDNICAERKDCDPGISAAITAIPGAVFAGHMDGRLRVYDTDTGKVIWEHDSYRDYASLSGEPARGGSFGGGSGPMIADGKVYANAGYGLYFHIPGNVLLVFGVTDNTE
ncbi:MAG: PQQ-binding-like beta-propeller repeat protein [Gammaproteobacteria bacterium]